MVSALRGTVCVVLLFLASVWDCQALQLASFLQSVSHKPAPASTGRVLSQTFNSTPFALQPGGVSIKTGKFELPSGHILMRDLRAELVRKDGSSVPLSDVYLHHWVVLRFHQERNGTAAGPDFGDAAAAAPLLGLGHRHPLLSAIPGLTPVPNAGVCQHGALSHWLGAGGEVRGTDGSFPPPHGIELNNPAAPPEVWYGQVHALDLRGAVDPSGCTECSCELYNQSAAQLARFGRHLPADYRGGLFCCPDGAQCRLREGYVGEEETYHLRYTVDYVPFDECAVPLSVYQLDVTDTGERTDSFWDGCQIEYPVAACDPDGPLSDCTDTREVRVRIPAGGDLVYAVGHLHAGGALLSLRREEGGEVLCESVPRYGQTAATPGDEAGYVTGMSACRFGAGEAHIAANETLIVRATYSRLGRGHTGVMGLWFLGVAPEGEQRRVLADLRCAPEHGGAEEKSPWKGPSVWAIVAAFAAGAGLVALVAGVGFRYWRARNADSAYRPIDSAWPNA